VAQPGVPQPGVPQPEVPQPELAPPESVSPLEQAVAVVDRLVSPGGCPWDAKQTHRSLARFLLEETYEALDAIAADDPALLREELGDVLFQVLFHARLAHELPPGERFTIDDVAADAVAKLTRRHPHVFADVTVSGADEVVANWDEIKRSEKNRTSVTDGIALAQPALALAAKLVERSTRAGLEVDQTAPEAPAGEDVGQAVGEAEIGQAVGQAVGEAEIGARLFALAAEATRAGIDPELALRAAALRFAAAVRAAEATP
jgi:XTP/dITP diphosphohydrolase